MCHIYCVSHNILYYLSNELPVRNYTVVCSQMVRDNWLAGFAPVLLLKRPNIHWLLPSLGTSYLFRVIMSKWFLVTLGSTQCRAINVVLFLHVGHCTYCGFTACEKWCLTVKKKSQNCLQSDKSCSLMNICATGPFIPETNFWPRNVIKRDICYLNVCPSVCLSNLWVMAKRFNISKYALHRTTERRL